MSMNIHAKKGDKVIVTKESINNGYSHDSKLVKRLCEINKIYTVDFTSVGSWSTGVCLEEFPSVAFNSVNFEDFKESIPDTERNQLTKNCHQGDHVKSAGEIIQLAYDKKSIYYSHWGVKPAAFYLGLQFKMVMDLLDSGSLYNVIKKEPEKKVQTWFNQGMTIKHKTIKNRVENLEYIPREGGTTEVEFEDNNK